MKTSIQLHEELHKIKELFADVHNTKFFKSYTPIEEANTSKPKPDVHCPQWYVLAQEEKSSLSLSAGKEHHTKDNKRLANQDREWHRPFHI